MHTPQRLVIEGADWDNKEPPKLSSSARLWEGSPASAKARDHCETKASAVAPSPPSQDRRRENARVQADRTKSSSSSPSEPSPGARARVTRIWRKGLDSMSNHEQSHHEQSHARSCFRPSSGAIFQGSPPLPGVAGTLASSFSESLDPELCLN